MPRAQYLEAFQGPGEPLWSADEPDAWSDALWLGGAGRLPAEDDVLVESYPLLYEAIVDCLREKRDAKIGWPGRLRTLRAGIEGQGPAQWVVVFFASKRLREELAHRG